jgi:hypothetical protein
LRRLSIYEELTADPVFFGHGAETDCPTRRIPEIIPRKQPTRIYIITSTGQLLVAASTPKLVTTASNIFVQARSKTPRIKSYCPALVDIIILCYNYDKLGYYASTCPEPKKRDLKKIKEKEISIQVEKNKSGNKES